MLEIVRWSLELSRPRVPSLGQVSSFSLKSKSSRDISDFVEIIRIHYSKNKSRSRLMKFSWIHSGHHLVMRDHCRASLIPDLYLLFGGIDVRGQLNLNWWSHKRVPSFRRSLLFRRVSRRLYRIDEHSWNLDRGVLTAAPRLQCEAQEVSPGENAANSCIPD